MKRYIPIEKDYMETPLYKRVLQDNAVKLKNYYHEKGKYYHIEKNLLFRDSEIAFSLFTNIDLSFQPLLQASESAPAKLPHQILNTESEILIKASDMFLYTEYVKSLEDPLYSHKFNDKIKAALIKEKTKIIIKNVLSDPKSGKNIKEAANAVEQITNSILSNENILYDLISIKNHDYYTYIHCVNVAVLSLGLGIASNLPENVIFKLGFGALMHDLGKITIPPEIINKMGRLTSVEFRIFQNHVMEGVNLLNEQPYFPEESLSAVAQHHERLSGEGYPLNLTGAKITKYGKITAITDCYDTLTTERPLKPALTPFESLSIIVNDCEHYDSEYLMSFIKMLGTLEE